MEYGLSGGVLVVFGFWFDFVEDGVVGGCVGVLDDDVVVL